MQDQTLLRALLSEILLSSGPQKGARLASELRREYELRTGQRFSLKQWGHSRFVDLLEEFRDCVEITRPDGPGDIDVTLRVGIDSDHRHRAKDEDVSGAATPTSRLPFPIWQAFVNPDPNRRRFFNRRTRAVAHYVENSPEQVDAYARTRVQAWGEFAVPIQFISAETQRSWMIDHLTSITVSEQTRSALERLVRDEYTSAVNAIFSKGLGPAGSAWRVKRTCQVVQHIRNWASENQIDVNDLFREPRGHEFEPPEQSYSPSDRRRMLHALIDTLRDEQLGSVLVPLDAVDRLLNTPRSDL
jgi:hypothetical protein